MEALLEMLHQAAVIVLFCIALTVLFFLLGQLQQWLFIAKKSLYDTHVCYLLQVGW